MNEQPSSILFVCLGNICRSPLAEGIMRDIAEKAGRTIRIDSAGTGDWHRGNPPDRRSVAVARRHGIDISRLKARQIRPADFEEFDLILGLDASNVRNIYVSAPKRAAGRIALLMAHPFTDGSGRDVPDPYYGDDSDFEAVYVMLRQACEDMAAGWNWISRAAPKE